MERYDKIIRELEASSNLRELRQTRNEGKYIFHDGKRYLNLSSNDYLGLCGRTDLQERFLQELPASKFLMSNPASRLMTGNSTEYTALEESLSKLFNEGNIEYRVSKPGNSHKSSGREAIVLGSGYAVNSGLIAAIAQPGDLILADRLVHASIIDGLRLSGCKWERFRHNDTAHLERLIQKALQLNEAKSDCPGTETLQTQRIEQPYSQIWVITESVFSMDGDTAPLKELVRLKKEYGIRLILDEAHAFGVFGPQGQGLAFEQGLQHEIDITIATFGKAIASVGGFAMVPYGLKRILVNRMRTLIFSTALPPINLLWSTLMVETLPSLVTDRQRLKDNIGLFYSLTGTDGNSVNGHNLDQSPQNSRETVSSEDISLNLPPRTQIIPVMAYSNDTCLRMARQMREEGLWVTPIRYPTVPEGQARIRMSLTAAMDENDIRLIAASCNKFKPETKDS